MSYCWNIQFFIRILLNRNYLLNLKTRSSQTKIELGYIEILWLRENIEKFTLVLHLGGATFRAQKRKIKKIIIVFRGAKKAKIFS